jgi:hypothetical protein
MATVVSIPVPEMNEFGLPRVCVMTGSTDSVTFEKEKFAYVPPSVRGAAIIPLLYIILASLRTERAVGTLPYSTAGLAEKKKISLFRGLSLLFGGVMFFVGTAVMGQDLPGLALLIWLVALAVPIGVALTMVRNKMPVAVKIENGIIDLRVPNDEAAKAIVARVGAPKGAGTSFAK